MPLDQRDQRRAASERIHAMQVHADTMELQRSPAVLPACQLQPAERTPAYADFISPDAAYATPL